MHLDEVPPPTKPRLYSLVRGGDGTRLLPPLAFQKVLLESLNAEATGRGHRERAAEEGDTGSGHLQDRCLGPRPYAPRAEQVAVAFPFPQGPSLGPGSAWLLFPNPQLAWLPPGRGGGRGRSLGSTPRGGCGPPTTLRSGRLRCPSACASPLDARLCVPSTSTGSGENAPSGTGLSGPSTGSEGGDRGEN